MFILYPSAINNPAMDNRGDYMEVKDPKVVETYPAHIDGKATLFFDFEHWTFCSKNLSMANQVSNGSVFNP